MKRILFLLLAFATVFTSCEKDEAQDNDQYLGTWEAYFAYVDTYEKNTDELYNSFTQDYEEREYVLRVYDDNSFTVILGGGNVQRGIYVRKNKATIEMEYGNKESDVEDMVFEVKDDYEAEMSYRIDSHNDDPNYYEKFKIKFKFKKK